MISRPLRRVRGVAVDVTVDVAACRCPMGLGMRDRAPLVCSAGRLPSSDPRARGLRCRFLHGTRDLRGVLWVVSVSALRTGEFGVRCYFSISRNMRIRGTCALHGGRGRALAWCRGVAGHCGGALRVVIRIMIFDF